MRQSAITASSAELTRLSELIDSIYQGATQPSHWNTVLPAIADWVGAERGVLFTPLNAPVNDGFYFAHELSEAVAQLWWTKYQPQDIWTIRSVERGLISEGDMINGDDLVPFAELSRTELYQDFFSKHDIAHLLSGIVFGIAPLQRNPYVVISLLRGLRGGAFESFERERLAILVPHLSRSLGVMTRLRDAELKAAASLAALDRLSTGVLLFRQDGVVGFANRVARRILEEEDGISMQLRFNDSALGNVLADDKRADHHLRAAITGAISPDILHTEHFSRSVVVPRPSGRQPYTLNFSSLATHNEFGSGIDAPRAIAFITDSTAPVRLDAALMKQTYGLTPTEIRVAEILAECLTADEVAERLRISTSTVKVHMRNIYDKTGANTRARLMKLLMSLARID
ncbi:MAG TPA: helix-turn-helix transcriptional regulator [Gallionella sp.]